LSQDGFHTRSNQASCRTEDGLALALVRRRMRVLIVDDYPGLIELYAFALAARGFEVEGAATAGEALMRVAQERFDAVVLDYQLPDVPGSVVVRRMRALASLAGAPIVGISSCAPGDVPAGTFDAFLPKPVHPKQLASTLRRLLALTKPDDRRDKPHLPA
jgi:CheY-like chemotaxis protein